MSKTNIAWHNLSISQVLKELNTSKQGLSSVEANKRLAKFGFNILAKARKFSIGLLIISQFKSALVYVLLIAGLVTIFLGEFVDSYVIFAAVLLNVVVGFIQEYKANKSLDKLNKVVKQETIVLRDGHEQKIESKYLVPGDVIILKAGDRVAADARLLSLNDFQVNEASLTGESFPVKKDLQVMSIGVVLAERINMVFMGTLIVEGRAQAVITNTGFQTEIGHIASMLKDTKDEKTPLQEKIDIFAKDITKIIILIAVLIFILGLVRGHQWSEMFTIAVAVAVAAIPEGLVISMTMILTIGMQRILKKNGLVRRLVSAETLGSTTIICTDKTGTLTEGEMRVTQVITDKHKLDIALGSFKDVQIDKELETIINLSLLCNDSVVENPDDVQEQWKIIGGPTEKALFLFGYGPANFQELKKKYPRVEEIPFDSQHKFMMTRHSFDKQHDIVFVKGAPEKVLSFSTKYLTGDKVSELTKTKFKYFDEAWQSTSKRGLRVLAGGYKLVPKSFQHIIECKNNPHDFIFVGIWGLSDPLRPETINTLQKTLAAGIRTIIITGDNKFTAKTIAKELGLDVSNENVVVTGDELLKMSDRKLAERIKDIKVFARVTPSDKLRIIKAWQEKGEVVSMSGDGVNDAPALKAADIGVAVSSGSDIAKETADLVLLDNNFNTIVTAIKQGRVIFANIKKVVLYLLSGSFAEIIIIATSLLLGLPLPILTAQILWVNLVNDGFPALALTMEPEEEEIMNTKPSKDDQKLFNFESKFLTAVISLITAVGSLILFWVYWQQTGDLVLARTVSFTALAINTLGYVFSIRNLNRGILRVNPFKNKYLNMAVVVGFFMQLAAVYLPFLNKALHTTPLAWSEWGVIFLVIAIVIVFVELVKFIFNTYYKHQKHRP